MKRSVTMTVLALGLAASPVIIYAPHAMASETAALAKTSQESEKDWIDALNARVDLAQAKVSVLKAQVALEVEKSQDRARKALNDAEVHIAAARQTVSEKGKKNLATLQNDAQSAKETVAALPQRSDEAIKALLGDIDAQIKSYRTSALETDEAKLLEKRYAQLQAQAALLQLQLAENADKTRSELNAYLDEAKASYAEAKTYASEKEKEAIASISSHIESLKKSIAEHDAKARDKILEALKKAEDLLEQNEKNNPHKNNSYND